MCIINNSSDILLEERKGRLVLSPSSSSSSSSLLHSAVLVLDVHQAVVGLGSFGCTEIIIINKMSVLKRCNEKCDLMLEIHEWRKYVHPYA